MQLMIVALPSALSMIAVLVGILVNNSRLGDVNARMSDMNARMSEMRSELRGGISELRSHMDQQFSHVDKRFDEARDTWRAELRRVEEVIDARLKHLEER